MTKVLQRLTIGTTLLAALTLAGCSGGDHTATESFAFSGDTLKVLHNNANMPVTVSAHTEPVEKGSEVIVTVNTRTSGRSPETPAWSMTEETLRLDTPCGGSVVGYCEASYSVKAPKGTEVTVNNDEPIIAQ